MPRRMQGKVTGVEGLYHVVETDGPAHLNPLYLVRYEVGVATVGDTVTLEYRTTPSSGRWVVVEVHEKEQP